MKIANCNCVVNNIKFKGLEAQALQAIYVQGDTLLGANFLQEELEAIAQKHKVQVFKTRYCNPWLQDGITFTPDGRILTANKTAGEALSSRHGLKYDPILNPDGSSHHIPGGNLFFVTNKDGKKVALTAENYNHECKIRGMEEFYNVDKIIELPCADFHADLFLTPIGDNKILVADDQMMLNNMVKIIEKIENYIENNPDDIDCERMKRIAKNVYNAMMEMFQYKNDYVANGAYDDAAKVLEKEGFEVIRVPSVFYESHKKAGDKNIRLRHRLNYSNAVTYKNSDNEVIYITGKSELAKDLGINERISEKIGVDFEKFFIDSTKPHVKQENIHFITGHYMIPISELLYSYQGGLHCMCAEVPVVNKNEDK